MSGHSESWDFLFVKKCSWKETKAVFHLKRVTNNDYMFIWILKLLHKIFVDLLRFEHQNEKANSLWDPSDLWNLCFEVQKNGSIWFWAFQIYEVPVCKKNQWKEIEAGFHLERVTNNDSLKEDTMSIWILKLFHKAIFCAFNTKESSKFVLERFWSLKSIF